IGRIAVAKGHVDGPIFPDDRVRALVLVAGVRVGRSAEDGAESRVGSADVDPGGPGGTASRRLAEVERAVGRRKTRPGGVNVVHLRAALAGVCHDEFLVVEYSGVIVAGHHTQWDIAVLLERKGSRGVGETAT